MLVAEVDSYVTTLFPLYHAGHLLVAGGVADQPARYLAMNLEMDRLGALIEEKHVELMKESDE